MAQSRPLEIKFADRALSQLEGIRAYIDDRNALAVAGVFARFDDAINLLS